jgi:hypothetical protein
MEVSLYLGSSPTQCQDSSWFHCVPCGFTWFCYVRPAILNNSTKLRLFYEAKSSSASQEIPPHFMEPACSLLFSAYTGRFITFSVITNIYNKKTTHASTRCACVARTWISYQCVPCHPWCTQWTSLVVKKNYFSFPVAVNNSIKVGPLVILL